MKGKNTMKRIPVVSGIAAAAAGIIVSLLILFTPSENIDCANRSADGTIFTVSSYVWGKLLHISKDGEVKSVFLGTSFTAPEYSGIEVLNGKIYLLGEDEDSYSVSVYDKSGKSLEKNLPVDFGSYDNINSVFLSADTASDERGASRAVMNLIVISEDNKIDVCRFGSGKAFSAEKRYNLENGLETVWAQHDGGVLYYMNDEGEIFRVAEDGKAERYVPAEGIVPFKPFEVSGEVYYTNIHTGAFERFSPEKSEGGMFRGEVIYGENSLLPGGVSFSDLRKITLSGGDGEGGVNDRKLLGLIKQSGGRGRVAVFDADGGTVYDEPMPDMGLAACAFLVCAAVVFAVLCAVLFLFAYVMSLRKLVVKQIIASLTVLAVSFFPVWLTVRAIIQDIVDQQIIGASIDFVKYAESCLDMGRFAEEGLSDKERAAMREFENYSLSEIMSFTSVYHNILNRGEMFSIVNYIDVARVIDGEYYYEYYSHQRKGAEVSYFYSADFRDRISSSDSGAVLLNSSDSYNTSWVEIIRPLSDDNGNIIGFIQAGYNYKSLKRRVSRNAFLLTLWAVLFLAAVAFVLLLSVLKLLKPLKKIKRAVSEISEGKIGTTVAISSNDELQDIAFSFSEMSRKLEKYFNSINVISKAYERFLPRDFFRLMGKKNVLDIKPSDSCEITLTYLFVGIDLYNIHKNGGDSFKMIDRIYSEASEAVTSRGGAIQNLDDRCITAIYNALPADAVEAGLALLEKMRAYNDGGAGITVTVQRAASTIGIIGTNSAMDSVTVSSAVDLQRYINEIMNRYDLDFIITDNAKSELSGINVTLRCIGRLPELCHVEGRYDIDLYEVLDGCGGSAKTLKMSSLASFRAGMDAMREGDYSRARRFMADVVRINRADRIAEHYLIKADEMLNEYAMDR